MNKEKGLRTLREITALFDQHGVRFAPVTREIADKLAAGSELTADDRLSLFDATLRYAPAAANCGLRAGIGPRGEQ